MAIMKLKLGKGSRFVKGRLRRFPQDASVWEADFQPISDEGNHDFWFGMVVDQSLGIELAHEVLDAPPTVNDLAQILAEAIQRPIIEGSRHRPSTLRLRDEAQWQELLPHLQELGIEIVKTNTLPAWEAAAAESGREHARQIQQLRPALTTQNTLIAAMFPTIAQWVRHGGWIELGQQSTLGLVARALDSNGIVFENAGPRTLDEAMAALEYGISKQIAENPIRRNSNEQ